MGRETSFVLAVLAWSPIILSAQDSTQVRQEALRRFDAYAPKIEDSQGMKLKYRRALVGHLNADERLDAAVEFGLGTEKGNKAVERQIAIYLGTKEGLDAVAGIEPAYCPRLLKIEDERLIVEELRSCIQPSPQGKLEYFWNGESMESED